MKQRTGQAGFRRHLVAQVALVSALSLLSVGAEATDSVAALRAEMESLRNDYEERIAELEKRLDELESRQPDAAEVEMDAIRAAARDAAATGVQVTPPPTEGPVVGRERNLNRLNPEISATGIFLANKVGGESGEFAVDEVELDIQAALDPFSRMRLTLAYHGEEVEIEEGFVLYGALPGAMEIMAGKFRRHSDLLW
jgi:hypothetical protein